MIFSNLRNKNCNSLTLYLNSEVINQTHEARFLGVIVDDRLTFNSHRAAIAKKVSRNAGIFFRARHMFTQQTLKTLYSSFIQSHLIFCSYIWGTGSKYSLQNIFIAQKKAIRAITFTKLFTKDEKSQAYSYGHTKSLFKMCGFLSVHNLILVQMLSQMHKIYCTFAPTYTKGIFTSTSPPIPQNNNPDPSVRLSNGLDPTNIIQPHADIKNNKIYYTIPQFRLAKQKQTITYLGPLSYNHFCNKLQQQLDHSNPKFKYIVHKLSPKCFLAHIKKQILLEQSLGLPNTWEKLNMPMYTISTSPLTLRTRQLD